MNTKQQTNSNIKLLGLKYLFNMYGTTKWSKVEKLKIIKEGIFHEYISEGFLMHSCRSFANIIKFSNEKSVSE